MYVCIHTHIYIFIEEDFKKCNHKLGIPQKISYKTLLNSRGI